MVDKAVNHSCRHLVIGKNTAPFGKFQICSQYQAFAFIAVRYDTEQKLGAILVYRNISSFIQNEQVKAAQIPQETLQRSIFASFRQF